MYRNARTRVTADEPAVRAATKGQHAWPGRFWRTIERRAAGFAGEESFMIERVAGGNAPDANVAATATESLDYRMVCLMRLVLSLSALVVIYIDPAEPDRFVVANYVALALYIFYSAALYLLPALHEAAAWEGLVPWLDVGCYLVLISLSSGSNSIFFFFFFFAILAASFRQGFKAGLSVAVVSALCFTLVGFITAPPQPQFEWNRFLLRPIYLLVLGYMMAYWGGKEISFKRQLNLLREVPGLANPRFGVAHTLGSVMRRLRAFYDADGCLLVWSEARADQHYLITSRRNDEQPPRVEQIPTPLAHLLNSLPENLSVVYNGRRTARYFREKGYYASAPAPAGDGRSEAAALAERLAAESFVSIPARFRGRVTGRLYLTGRRGIFVKSDVEFLQQIVEQVAPVLDNIRLLERLASNAAEQERQRLARDIHDSVIQPYLGLQYRLAAIRNKLAAGGADVAADLERLYQSTADEVNGLRGFVRGLKDSDERRGDLAAAVQRFAAQFGDDYGIEVQVECAGRLNVNDRLAAEVIRFVHEGLSNVRKHTRAARVTLSLGCGERDCILRIENDGAPEDVEVRPRFTPRSITERARELGGHVRVERAGPDRTVVTIEIPL
ncbi:MAG TPA: histidine kinase [Pyrinomonadaceae bacterium]